MDGNEVAQVAMPHWSAEQRAPLSGAGHAASPFAGKGATVAMVGAPVLADALADRPDRIEDASAAYEARFRPCLDVAQRMAKRNVHLSTPANRFQSVAGEAVLRFARRSLFALVVRRLLNHEGERL